MVLGCFFSEAIDKMRELIGDIAPYRRDDLVKELTAIPELNYIKLKKMSSVNRLKKSIERIIERVEYDIQEELDEFEKSQEEGL